MVYSDVFCVSAAKDHTLLKLATQSVAAFFAALREAPLKFQLISIYAKDRAIEKDAQTIVDIVEEIDAEDMDVSATQSQPSKPNQDGSTSSKKQKKISDGMIQESAQKLYLALCEVEGLTEDERYRALSKIPDHPTQMLIFFSLPLVQLE
ncbi:hypothetical protein Gotri_000536, partial [Gossypium trilobum]|nr:hypothetical protein [Gossypium trilobum]